MYKLYIMNNNNNNINNNNINNNNINSNFNITDMDKVKKAVSKGINTLNKATTNAQGFASEKIKNTFSSIYNNTSNIYWGIIFILFFYVFML